VVQTIAKVCLTLLTSASAVERVTGIEPALPAWKAGTLPLSYTRERAEDIGA
jgi:hypothetical protein